MVCQFSLRIDHDNKWQIIFHMVASMKMPQPKVLPLGYGNVFSMKLIMCFQNARHYQVRIGNFLSWSYFEFVKMSMATFHKRGNGCLANIFITSSVMSSIVIPNWMCAFINPFWVLMRCLTCSQGFLSISFSAYSRHSCIGLFILNNFFLSNMLCFEEHDFQWVL